MDTFIECTTIADANRIDMTKYRFIDGMSAKKGVYCFMLRQNKRVAE